MAKYILLKYEPWGGPGYHTRGVMYTLTLLKITFFGLVKREVTTSQLLESHHDFKSTYENWDKMIENKTVVKN